VQFPFSLTGYTSFGIFQYLLWRHRITDRAIGFPLIQGAYMSSFRTADALLGGIAANHALYFVFCRHNYFTYLYNSFAQHRKATGILDISSNAIE